MACPDRSMGSLSSRGSRLVGPNGIIFLVSMVRSLIACPRSTTLSYPYPCASRRAAVSFYQTTNRALLWPAGHSRSRKKRSDDDLLILKSESGPGVRRSAFSPGQTPPLSVRRHHPPYPPDSPPTTSQYSSS